MSDAPNPLELAANRASEDPFFLGSTLAEHLHRRGWSREDLAEYMCCSQVDLLRLYLCRQPELASEDLALRVDHIAHTFHCDASRLLSLLREKAVRLAFREDPSPAPPISMAARDRKEDPPNAPNSTTNEQTS